MGNSQSQKLSDSKAENTNNDNQLKGIEEQISILRKDLKEEKLMWKNEMKKLEHLVSRVEDNMKRCFCLESVDDLTNNTEIEKLKQDRVLKESINTHDFLLEKSIKNLFAVQKIARKNCNCYQNSNNQQNKRNIDSAKTDDRTELLFRRFSDSLQKSRSTDVQSACFSDSSDNTDYLTATNSLESKRSQSRMVIDDQITVSPKYSMSDHQRRYFLKRKTNLKQISSSVGDIAKRTRERCRRYLHNKNSTYSKRPCKLALMSVKLELPTKIERNNRHKSCINLDTCQFLNKTNIFGDGIKVKKIFSEPVSNKPTKFNGINVNSKSEQLRKSCYANSVIYNSQFKAKSYSSLQIKKTG